MKADPRERSGASLSRLHNPSSSNAGCTHPNSLASSVNHSPHPMQVGVPSSLGCVVGVADVIPEHRAFSTEFTSGSHHEASFKPGCESERIAEGIPRVKCDQPAGCGWPCPLVPAYRTAVGQPAGSTPLKRHKQPHGVVLVHQFDIMLPLQKGAHVRHDVIPIQIIEPLPDRTPPSFQAHFFAAPTGLLERGV